MEEKQLEYMRHSCAHLVAAAVQELYPNAKFGVGPAIENGFYYDIDFGAPISEGDLQKIEEKAKELGQKGLGYARTEMTIEEAKEFFSQRNQPFKVELLQDIQEKGSTRMKEQDIELSGTVNKVSIYQTGEFIDLCRGGHIENTKDIGAFKLTKLSGAYWRGSEKNPQLTRVYGVLFPTQKELDDYLTMMEEAKKRDHRKLGKELELFTVIDEIGGGLPLFYPQGAVLRRLVENFVIEAQERRGYVPIWIPHITKGKLYEISGHLQKYDAMYPPMHLEGEADYYLKPMNCPHFMMLYKTQMHSYRELPMRCTCTTTNYRYEKSGELSGLTRVRALTQDDCHVFTRPDQIEQEINLMLDMINEIYNAFTLKDFWVRISVHDPANKEKYIGDTKIWKESEAALSRLIENRGWKHEVGVGEAAFYGPKLDFMAKDVLGREWQLSTIQLDMNLPERFDLEYTANDGSKQRPVVIHRAILGSIERFLGILIEHFGGKWPVWLSPAQAVLVPVSEKHVSGALALKNEMFDLGIRIEIDDANETLGNRVRKAANRHIPYIIVIGDKELNGEDWMVKVRGEKDQLRINKADFIAKVKKETVDKL